MASSPWGRPLACRDAWIVKQCQNRQVLHLGCTDWPLTEERLRSGRLLHAKLAQTCTKLVGIDSDLTGIRQLARLMPDHEFHAISGESMAENPNLAGRSFDVILAADVIEHVSNLGCFLSNCRSLLKESGDLIITTPSAFSLKRNLFLALSGKEHVHPDHIAYFSASTLTQNLLRAGFHPLRFHGFQWINPTWSNRLANALVSLPVRWSGGRLADEIAVVARPVSSAPS